MLAINAAAESGDHSTQQHNRQHSALERHQHDVEHARILCTHPAQHPRGVQWFDHTQLAEPTEREREWDRIFGGRTNTTTITMVDGFARSFGVVGGISGRTGTPKSKY